MIITFLISCLLFYFLVFIDRARYKKVKNAQMINDNETYLAKDNYSNGTYCLYNKKTGKTCIMYKQKDK